MDTTTKPKGKHPGGRPTIFTQKVLKQIEFLAKEKGFTDVEISKALGIDESTLTKYKQRNPKFFMSLKDWKIEADEKVEKSLYERACGYSHPDTHVSNYQGEITMTPIIKTYPPDPTSMIFWLKNRRRDEWRDKLDHEVSGKDGAPIEIIVKRQRVDADE